MKEPVGAVGDGAHIAVAVEHGKTVTMLEGPSLTGRRARRMHGEQGFFCDGLADKRHSRHPLIQSDEILAVAVHSAWAV